LDATPNNRPASPGNPHERSRYVLALLLAAVSCVFIWVATPYNNMIMEVGFISDNYTPIGALFCAFLIVLFLNPLLRRFTPHIALRKPQLALVLGVLLVASMIPGQGLHRFLPYMIARAPVEANGDIELSGIHGEMQLPASLFADPIGEDVDCPASRHFVESLPAGEGVPWSAWVGPLLSWGTFLVFLWLMMVGLSLIVYPQWRHASRLQFPLLTAYEAIIEDPKEGHLFTGLLHSTGFWLACSIVFILHTQSALNTYFPQTIPPFPLRWNLWPYFQQPPLSQLPNWIKSSQLYFTFIGIAFFMQKRISFSIWFFALVYGIYFAFVQTYAPPFQWGSMDDQRNGVIIALTIGVLWLDRAHWARVGRLLIRHAITDDDRRYKKAGWMFVIGNVGGFVWLVWAGMQPLWAFVAMVMGFMMMLIVARLIAETGMPMARIIGIQPHVFAVFVPAHWFTAATIFMATFLDAFFSLHTRMALTPLATHGIGLDDAAPPQRQWRTGVLYVGVLVAGLIISGAAHLRANYDNELTLRGDPMNRWGHSRMTAVHNHLKRHADARNWPEERAHNRWGHMAFGAALTGGLQWACMQFPTWPLHPMGLILVFTWHGNISWVSIFLGWLCKVLILRFGGSRLHNSARPVFLGLVFGEVFAAVVWSLIPAILAVSGIPYHQILLQPN